MERKQPINIEKSTMKAPLKLKLEEQLVKEVVTAILSVKQGW